MLIQFQKKKICNLNNGKWNNFKCSPQDGYNEPVNKDISAKDLCENTGYKYDKDINYCYKDILGTNKKTDTTTYGEYCSNKTLKDTNDIVNWSTHNLSPESTDYKRPCSVCQFFEVLKKVHLQLRTIVKR